MPEEETEMWESTIWEVLTSLEIQINNTRRAILDAEYGRAKFAIARIQNLSNKATNMMEVFK